MTQILFKGDFCDKLSVFDKLEKLNKAYRIYLKEVVAVTNYIDSVVLIPLLPYLLDSKLLSLSAKLHCLSQKAALLLHGHLFQPLYQ